MSQKNVYQNSNEEKTMYLAWRKHISVRLTNNNDLSFFMLDFQTEERLVTYHDVLCTINCIPQVPKLSKRHDEHLRNTSFLAYVCARFFFVFKVCIEEDSP